ncbi:MAG: UDP-N-acetylmuramoyl-L-alanyl-D-glutamate--2,6-diaminopimelate ligase [Lachnospiraceae bacterium]|nr:UDP-N-acetylmuramoyl-L-alanyl-D-glutamate--2,6-diaminopimelate ligase [Lachnospiraceae bacterium]
MNNVKNLNKLLRGLDYELINGKASGKISELVEDTRKVVKDCLFVCIKGSAYDSHEHLQEIIDKGVKAIVIEKDNEAAKSFISSLKSKVAIIAVDNTESALCIISAAYFDNPVDKIKVIGITGTKGKTTTTYMVKSILEHAGYNVGLIGTIEITYGDVHIPSVNTTPGSYMLQEHFAKMVDKGIDICVMEVSSQAMLRKRVDGFTFEMGIFTNISPDHIGPNEHSSFENYLECKSMLFEQCRYAIVNGDDEHANFILDSAKCDTLTYGFNEGNDLTAYDLELVNNKGILGVDYKVKGRLNIDAKVNMPGRFSAYNSLCAIAICNRLGVDIDITRQAVENAKVKGRIEMQEVPGEYTLMIDYAHNAMSLKALLESLREYNPNRLVVVFGAGGNRAKGRRYSMGSVAARYADYSVITSDNPRDEEPFMIIKDIMAGYKMGLLGDEAEDIDDLSEDDVNNLVKDLDLKRDHFMVVEDRVEAIGFIMLNAKKGDLIVLAGKGHEDYQIIKGEKHHLDEREVIADIAKGIRNLHKELSNNNGKMITL